MVGIKTWFTPTGTTPSGIPNNVRKWMGRNSMFITGFIISDTQPKADLSNQNKTSIDYGTFNEQGNEENNADREPRTKGINQLYDGTLNECS